MNILIMKDVEFFTLYTIAGLTSFDNSPVNSINASVIETFGKNGEEGNYDFEAEVKALYQAGMLVELPVENSSNVKLMPKKEIYTILEWIARPEELITIKRVTLVSEPVVHFVRYKNTYLRLSLAGDGNVIINLPFNKLDMVEFFTKELTVDYEFEQHDKLIKAADISTLNFRLSLNEMIALNCLSACQSKFGYSQSVTAAQALAALVLQSKTNDLPKVLNNKVALKDMNLEMMENSLLLLRQKGLVVENLKTFSLSEVAELVFVPKLIKDFIGVKINNKIDTAKILHILPYGIKVLNGTTDEQEDVVFTNVDFLPFQGDKATMFEKAAMLVF